MPPRSFIRKIIPIIGYCFFLFCILEIVARLALSNPQFIQLVNGENKADAIWRLDWIKNCQLKKKGFIEYHYDLPDPTKGWKLKPDIKDAPENGKLLNTNSKGIRGTSEFSYEKVPGKIRILVLGESFTFGTEVGDDEVYCHYLQRMLPDAEVINFAVHGYGFDQMLIYLKEEGIKYQPDIVLIPFLEVDKNRSLLSFRDYAKPMFVLKHGRLVLTHSPVPEPEEMYKREFWRLKIIDLINILGRNIAVKSGSYQRQEEALNEAILNEIVKTIREVNARPVFLYLEGIRDSVKKTETDDKYAAFAQYWFPKQVYSIYSLPYLKAITAMQLHAMGLDNKPVVVRRKYGHFSPREHMAIAVSIKDSLQKHGFLVGKP